MALLKFITPKLESIFVGMVVFTINDKETPLQVAEIIDDHLLPIFKLVDINSGGEAIVDESQFLVLSVEDNGKCFPVKYSRLGTALNLIKKKILDIHFIVTYVDNGLTVAKV